LAAEMNIPSPIEQISIEGFNYELPDDCIAKYPLELRDQSKLLVWKNGEIADEAFTNLPNVLSSDNLLIFNNTKVIRARLLFRKPTGAAIEIFLLEPHSPTDYAQNFQQNNECSWYCVVGNQKKWKSGELHLPVPLSGTFIKLTAEVWGDSSFSKIIRFSWDDPMFTFSEIIEAAGQIPIPPYLHRESEESDITRYQTIYSKIKGSVAAPTAGLHFTEPVLKALREKGIKTAETTLHVGAGTFQPVKSSMVAEHEMHTEHIVIERSLVELLLTHEGRVIAVGTTSVRTLESLYWLGLKIKSDNEISACDLSVLQWEPYSADVEISMHGSLRAIIEYMDRRNLEQINASTQIIIVPGYRFRVIDGMITNFHQPQSTLLLLISAFIGDDWKGVYQHALKNNYRFLSYGDSNLYLRHP
jgi:S-adenosylmethionine:tRNA ribosyltransferase-isomerase